MVSSVFAMAFLTMATAMSCKNIAGNNRYPLFCFRPLSSFILRKQAGLSCCLMISNIPVSAHLGVSSTDPSPSSDVASLVWFRKDLRIHDHEPLWRAANGRHDPVQLTGNFEQMTPQVSLRQPTCTLVTPVGNCIQLRMKATVHIGRRYARFCRRPPRSSSAASESMGSLRLMRNPGEEGQDSGGRR
jgi:hypothetical protein